jgi:hypothetical protein
VEITESTLGELEARGLFRLVPADELAAARAEVLETGDPFPDATRRAWHADAESLAEQGMVEFLAEVLPFLEREGVACAVRHAPSRMRRRNRRTGEVEDVPGPVLDLSVSVERGGENVPVSDQLDDEFGRYAVAIGDRTFFVYDDDSATDSWFSATYAMIQILDDLLTGHGSPERAYARWPATNDLAIAFASPDLAAKVNEVVPPSRRLWSREELAAHLNASRHWSREELAAHLRSSPPVPPSDG